LADFPGSAVDRLFSRVARRPRHLSG
jgi:hypothetical protein